MPRNVIFVAPVIDEPAARFLRALGRLDDVQVLGVVHKHPSSADARLFADLVRIPHPLNPEAIIEGVGTLRRNHGQPFRIVGALEAIKVQLAMARERFGVPGVSVRTASVFRDKSRMKDALRAAGLPVARHGVLRTEADARAFVAEVGLPIVLKPIDGVGARSTARVTTMDALFRMLREMGCGPGSPALAEEMLVGKEHSFEAITIGGEPRVFSFSEYLPGCLEVLENPWIQWSCLLPREVDTPLHDRARKLGFEVIRTLGLENGMTHMEWFERSDGSLAVGEIAQRPPGPQLCQMTGLVHGIDIHRAWARAVVDGKLDAPWTRTHAAGTVFIRGQGPGRVRAIHGVEETRRGLGEHLVEMKLPEIGAPKNTSDEGDGYVVVCHRETNAVKTLLGKVMQTLKITYA